MRLAVLTIILVAAAVWLVPNVAAAPAAVVQKDSAYIDSVGFYHVVGEVRNTGNVWLHLIKITATLRGTDGRILDTPFSYALLDQLPPNELAGFNLAENSPTNSAAVASYSLALEFQETQPRPLKLLVTNTTALRNSFGQFEITGEVQNLGDSISQYSKVVGTFYGANGRVVDVQFTYTDPTNIPPNAYEGFKLIVPSAEISNLITAWSVTADSAQYTSVTEFPWPLVLVASLGMAMFTFAYLSKNQKNLDRI